MKNTSNIWKRLLSLTMALFMVLSYVPAEVFAEEVPTAEPALLTVSVVSVAVPAATEAVPDETGDPVEVVENTAAPTEYTHTVTVQYKGNEVTDAVITGIDENSKFSATVTATVKYKGLVLSAASGETKTWKASASWDSLTAGSYLAAPAINCGEVDGATWSTSVTVIKDNQGNEIVGETQMLAVGELLNAGLIKCTLQAVQTLTFGDEVLMTLENEAVVGYAPATYSCSHESKWYVQMPESVQVFAETGVTDSAYLPSVYVAVDDGEPVVAAWNTAENGFICAIPDGGETQKKVTVAGQEFILKVDAEEPQISGMRAREVAGGTFVEVQYSVGISGGVLTIASGENVLDQLAVTKTEGTASYNKKFDQKLDGEITAKLVNGAGVSATANKTVKKLPHIVVVSGLVAEVPDQNLHYVKNDGRITFAVKNCDDIPRWWVVTKSGEEVAYVVDEEAQTLTVTLTDRIEGLSVCVSDGFMRDTQYTLDCVDFDKNNPTVELTQGEVFGETTYVSDEVTYTLTMADDIKIDAANSYAFFTLMRNGETVTETVAFSAGDKQASASYKVKNGEYLQAIEYTVFDAAGNKTANTAGEIQPRVEVDMDKPAFNVVSFEISATPNQIETGSKYLGYKKGVANLTATLTVELVEKNINEDSLDKTVWSKQGDTWIGTITTTVESGSHATMDLTGLNVADKAIKYDENGNVVEDGNKPVNNIEFDVVGMETYTMKFSPKEGKFVDGLLINNGDPNCSKPAALMDLTLESVSDVTIGDETKTPVFNQPVVIKVTPQFDSVTAYFNNNYGTAEYNEGVITATPDSGLERLVTVYAYADTSCDEEYFAVDTLGPRVKVQVAEGKTYENDSNHYYNTPVTLTFSVEDMLDADAVISYTIDGDALEQTVSENNTIVITAGHTLTALTVVAEDALGNRTETFTDYEFAPIVVDNTAPDAKIEIKKVDAETKKFDEYYDGEVKIVATTSDPNFLDATLTYTVNGSTVSKSVSEADQWVCTDGVWAVEIPVGDGDEITDIKLNAEDKAGNPCETVKSEDVKVDMTDPEIVDIQPTYGKDTKLVQTYEEKDYYDGFVTYTFTVMDKFLDLDNTSVVVTFADNKQEILSFEPIADADYTYSATIKIENGQTMTGYEVIAKDYVEHEATEAYAGNPVVVDTAAPTATLRIEGDVDAYYTRLVNGREYVFVKMNTPVDEDTNNHNEKETVTAIITIKDAEGNLTADDSNDFAVKGNGVQSATGVTNEVVYTKSVEVAADTTKNLLIDLTAFDLAGHPIEVLTEEVTSTNESITGIKIEENTGVVKANLVIDRRRPTGNDDVNPPEITIVMPEVRKVDGVDLKSSAGVDLYTEAIEIEVFVKDGKIDPEKPDVIYAENAGLKCVEWEIQDRRKYLTSSGTALAEWESEEEFESNFADPEKVVMSKTFSVYAGETIGETDVATLIVTAVDNMGNKISKSVSFAVDTQAPRIAGDYDNDSVANGTYFKDHRKLTLTVTDINLVDAVIGGTRNATISAKPVDPNGVYTQEIAYDSDDHHTFTITATDIAGRPTVDNVAFAEGTTAEYAFTVDTTPPRITTVFDPAVHSGTDPNGVLHYNRELTAVVTITEHNFSPKDLGTTGITLNYGADDAVHQRPCEVDDVHTASYKFDEGNNYIFNVTYTDLAGNEAEPYTSPTFSVDLTAPTVEITRGDLNLNGLNIVQEDLELAFTINDKQQNLSNYQVTVTHLNNQFQSTPVSGAKFYTITTQEKRTTVLVNFATIEALKENDGIYTVEISAVDYAGNTVQLTPNMVISLNRFGSTFTTNDPFTADFLTIGSDGNVYHDSIDNKLVIQEINPNRVWQDSTKKDEGSVLTVVVNGTATRLAAGVDYTVSVEQQGAGENKWYIYTYEINPDVFKNNGKIVDGRYAILIYGEDDAGNKNTNESNEYGAIQLNAAGEYTGRIEFVLDATAPIITTTGIDSGKTYNAEYQRLDIYLSDNIPTEIQVYLNNELVGLVESADGQDNAKAWLVYNQDVGTYTLNVPEQNFLFSGQNIEVIVTDAAGNVSEYLIDDFNVSTNLAVRLLNNTWFVAGSALALIAAVAFIVLKKKKANVKAA